MNAGRKRIVLIGDGAFSREIAAVARLNGYVIEATYSTQSTAQDGRYRGYLDELLADRAKFDGVALAVGGVSRPVIAARVEIIAWLDANGILCPPLVSPHALVCEGATVGAGSFIAHRVPVSVDARVGRFCVLNTGAIVAHDAVIGDNTTVSPSALISGRCQIGEGRLIGSMAKVLQGLTIGREATIGVGCNVLRNVPERASVWPKPDSIAST
ncbi:acetyltransferase [Methylobacterium sp. J-070]|uniref:acetyltransferase n=1 Tax=Methylobacterium sp. J-070 TaxID=2836650 RepID=UPI001FBB29F1|nr:acetyltransferase [Methylobacterium sp. J-070]MCJ2048961.1 acetyltransferase [Methylobacterium sp. J-070]